MGYEEAVQQAALDLERVIEGDEAAWDLARLTFENTKAAGDPATTAGVTMEQWCADVRAIHGRAFSYTTGHRYKGIWRRHGHLPAGERPSWTEALSESANPNGRLPNVGKGDIEQLVSSPTTRAAVVEALASTDAGPREVHDAYIQREMREDRKARLEDGDTDPLVSDVYERVAGEIVLMKQYGSVQQRITALTALVRQWDVEHARAEFAKYEDLTPLSDTIRDLQELLTVFRRIAGITGKRLEAIS